ncbi:hypothetical protein [Paenibacillus elgii]|uniref:hypothetical protein n=1 Tax=Paenibacillus elgii TaxID=189691 RepID=UPI00167AA1E1|nr:hypothetical protein [Paenibacillus elgii]
MYSKDILQLEHSRRLPLETKRFDPAAFDRPNCNPSLCHAAIIPEVDDFNLLTNISKHLLFHFVRLQMGTFVCIYYMRTKCEHVTKKAARLSPCKASLLSGQKKKPLI